MGPHIHPSQDPFLFRYPPFSQGAKKNIWLLIGKRVASSARYKRLKIQITNMASVQTLECREYGCNTKMIGEDTAELQEYMELHKASKHRKIFEYTVLGNLPTEILLKILGYVTPDCKDCFQQREIIKLGAVCKRLSELVKAPELYKEMRLISKCCPMPTRSLLLDIFQNRGSQLKRLIFRPPCYSLGDIATALCHAVETCGNVIQEIHVDLYDLYNLTRLEEISTKIDEMKPTALKKLQFTGVFSGMRAKFSIDLAMVRGTLLSRIVGLDLTSLTLSMTDLLKLAALAMENMKNLEKVTISEIKQTGTEKALKRHINQLLERDGHKLLSLLSISISYKRDSFPDVDIVMGRQGESPNLELDPKQGFNIFFKGLSDLIYT